MTAAASGSHLLAVELGPIVEFLSASRKTRDLWFGSWLFSELAKRVAERIAAECGGCERLIFPTATSVELQSPDFTVGDVILAELPAGTEPRQVADQARKAAHDAWNRYAAEAFKDLPSGDLEAAIWRAQTPAEIPPGSAGETIEVYAAWVPIGDSYPDARRQVMRLLAARTATRNFPPAPGNDSSSFGTSVDDAGRWKSSLDGRRPSVLAAPSPARRSTGKRDRRLRLNPGEQLDAPGVVKRLYGGAKNYPSTARLAADPWVRRASNEAPELFDDLQRAAERLKSEQLLGRIDTSRFPHYASFPYEGAVLYETRHAELLDEAGIEAERRAELLKDLRTALGRLTRRLGEPNPYYAVLAGDGDHVGRELDKVRTAAEHRRFSRELSEFAGRARASIAEHSGAAVYVGGDDVLAFVPVDRCIACADRLRSEFAGVRAGVSLSVGVVVWHFLDSLEDGLAAARETLDVAKRGGAGSGPERNALAVRYEPRGGAPLTVRGRWESGIADDFQLWAELLADDSLPAKAAYDLRKAADGYRAWPEGPSRTRALQVDLLRLLSRKRPTGRRHLEPLVAKVSGPDDVVTLANTIIVAGRIASAGSTVRGDS